MACFCNQPVEALPSLIPPSFGMMLPQVPLQMQLAVALPAIAPENRLDVQLQAFMAPLSLPSLSLNAGSMGLFNIAPVLSLIGGVLPLGDIPALELALDQMGGSLRHNVLPLTSWLASLKMAPLLNFALAARMVLDLRALGIEPFDMSFTMPAAQYAGHHFDLSLPRPQITMGRLLMGLPSLFTLTDMFSLPPLGEDGSFPGLLSAMHGLAGIKPPSIGISFPMLSKLALALNSLATIQAAFGDVGLSGMGLPRIRAMLNYWGGLPLPMPPMPAIALSQELAALPSLPSVEAGAAMATPSIFAPMMGFSMPQLGFLPATSLMVGLSASLELMLGDDVLDACSLCPFS